MSYNPASVGVVHPWSTTNERFAALAHHLAEIERHKEACRYIVNTIICPDPRKEAEALLKKAGIS